MSPHAFPHDATVCGPVRQTQRGYGAITGRLDDFTKGYKYEYPSAPPYASR